MRATRSAAWMFAAGLTTKVVGLVGTLLLVRWIAPAEYGEALVAAIVMLTASTLSSLGIGQFVIVKARGRRDLAFHATVYQLLLGVVALGVVVIVRDPLAAWSHAPGIGRYLPPMALSMLVDRLWFVPERTLMRDMRFRTVALARSAGELSYTAVSCAAALLGWGGMAIAAGNVARSAIRAAVTISAVDRRDWLEPCPLRRDSTVAVLRFGLPLAVGTIAAFAATRWDNLLVSSFFGPAVMAAYNVAYNLAGMASGLVSEHVVDVVVPSFARAEQRLRRDAFLRGARLVAVVATPLCIGLAAVAHTAVPALLGDGWPAVAPMLAVLGVVAAFGPLGGLIFAYLQGCDRPRATMFVQLVAAVAVLGGVATIGRLGPLWTCGAVGGGAFLSILAGALVLRSLDGIPLHRVLSTQVGPLLASVPLVGAVLGVRWVSSRIGMDVPLLALAVEVAAGALAYGVAVLAVAGSATRDLVALLRAAFLPRGAPSSAAGGGLDSSLEV